MLLYIWVFTEISYYETEILSVALFLIHLFGEDTLA